jgi:hypothetical protein
MAFALEVNFGGFFDAFRGLGAKVKAAQAAAAVKAAPASSSLQS